MLILQIVSHTQSIDRKSVKWNATDVCKTLEVQICHKFVTSKDGFSTGFSTDAVEKIDALKINAGDVQNGLIKPMVKLRRSSI